MSEHITGCAIYSTGGGPTATCALLPPPSSYELLSVHPAPLINTRDALSFPVCIIQFCVHL